MFTFTRRIYRYLSIQIYIYTINKSYSVYLQQEATAKTEAIWPLQDIGLFWDFVHEPILFFAHPPFVSAPPPVSAHTFAQHSVPPPSPVIVIHTTQYQVLVGGVRLGVLSCACVCRCRGCFLCRCVLCACDLLIVLHYIGHGNIV